MITTKNIATSADGTGAEAQNDIETLLAGLRRDTRPAGPVEAPVEGHRSPGRRPALRPDCHRGQTQCWQINPAQCAGWAKNQYHLAQGANYPASHHRHAHRGRDAVCVC